MNDKLRQLQLTELEILKEFVRICDKYGLRYYLVGGTLLGAVRHQGFIPWDDDIDVAMMRADYERFAEICQEELDSQYFYQSPETDPYYFLTYAKIRKNNTEIYEERFRNSKFHKGIFIDIFPLDFCPKPGLICHFLFNALAVMNYRGQVDSGEKYVPYQEISGKIGYWLLRVLAPRQIVRLRRRCVRLSEQLSKHQYIASYSGAYGYRKEVFPYLWFQSNVYLPFAGQEFSSPVMFHPFLSQVYGVKYLALPPKSERTYHIQLNKIHF